MAQNPVHILLGDQDKTQLIPHLLQEPFKFSELRMNLSDIFLVNITDQHTVYGNHPGNDQEITQHGVEWQKWLDNSQITISAIGK